MVFDYWVIFGFLAQFVFFLRFFVQWIHAERHKKSVVPLSFWYLSILGSLMIFVYAWVRRDPVFIAGTALGLFIYIRNIRLYKNNPPEA